MIVSYPDYVYESIILNPDLSEDYSQFINSPDVNRLSNSSMSIECTNIIFDRLLNNWIKRMAKKYCPENGDINKVIRVLKRRYML